MVALGSPYRNDAQTWSFVAATKTTGMLRSGVDVFVGRKPRLLISEMAFYGASGEQVETTRHSPFGRDRLVSSQTSGFGSGTITCSDYVPQDEIGGRIREIACITPKGDFSCFFGGSEEDAAQFYQTLRAVSPTE